MSKVRRRRFLIATGAFLATPLASFAQPAQKVRRIGFLTLQPHTPSRQKFWRDALSRGGYEEGRNLAIEWRFAENEAGRLPGLADELVRLNVELILAQTNEAIDEARHATQTIPIVMTGSMFPVERGVVKSLAHPGGNVTGMVWWAEPQEAMAKQFQIVKFAVPQAKQVAVLRYGGDSQERFYDLAHQERSLASIGMSQQRFLPMRRDELKVALDRIAASRPDALWVAGSLSFVDGLRETAEFALERKLVSLSDQSTYVSAGGLLSYGPVVNTIVDRTMSYVDRILRGAKPSDLPIEQTTKWEMLLNGKTARAIGFKPPPSFMLQVDRQIE